MNAKERVLAALKFQETDRTPAFVLGGDSWCLNEEGLCYDEMYKLPDAGASILVKQYGRFNNDIITAGQSCWLAWANAFGAKLETSRIGRSIEVAPCFTDLETDIPQLTDEELEAKLKENYYIDTMIRQIKEVKKLVGDEIVVSGGTCGPFTAAATLYGTGEFMKQIAKRNKKIPELLAFTTRVISIINKLFYEAGMDLFVIAEPVASGDMIAPRTFKQSVIPYFREFMENIKDTAPVILHICGDSGNRVDFMKDLGVVGFSVDSMVDMEEMLTKADHNFCMVGSLAPSDQMVLGTPESITKESNRLLELAKKNGGGFILATGCDCPSGVPFENMCALTQAAADFAK